MWEATVTLQDVQVLLGLKVHGDAVTCHGIHLWSDLLEELLGVSPPAESSTAKGVLQGSTLNIAWLKQQFRPLPNEADTEEVKKMSRIYILLLMGSHMFANTSGDRVSLLYLPLLRDLQAAGNFNWGSATLAFLYHQLSRACEAGKTEIGGSLILLQLWSWEHIHIGRPMIDRVRVPQDPELDEDEDP